MKITEYKIGKNKYGKPYLINFHKYDWKARRFKNLDGDVNRILTVTSQILDECFKLGISHEEYVYAVAFDVNFRLIGILEVSHGSISRSCIDANTLFTFLLLSGARKFVLAHNHPSGNLEHSENDMITTNHIEELSQNLKIDMIDHIVVGDGYYLPILQEKMSQLHSILKMEGELCKED
jgi:DNA repair protein RadC